jgi:opacity protein-like surface antigen
MHIRRRMKQTRFLALIALVFAVTPVLSAADFGIRAGRYNDSDQEFVGAELVFDLGAINFNPNIEYVLEDDTTAGTANLDVTFDVANISRVTPYVGAGVGYAYAEVGDAGAETDIVGNLIGGVHFNFDSLKPYAQVKYFKVLDNDNNIGNDDEIALTIGLRF